MHSRSDTEFPSRTLNVVGGAASLLAAVLVLCEVVMFAVYPQPAGIVDWYRLLRENPLIGWVDLWGLELLMYAAFVPMFIALYAALKKADPGWTKVALAAAMLGVGIFFATNNPASMMSLAREYAAASTDAERTALLGAGQALLAATGQRAVGGFNTGLFFVSVAGLIFSWKMLGGCVFERSAAITGLLAHALSLLDYLRAAVTSSEIALLLIVLPNSLLLVVFYILTGRTLLRQGNRSSPEPRSPDRPPAGR